MAWLESPRSQPAWYLDEFGYAGPEHVDPSYVAGYDRKAGFDPAPDVADLRSLGLDQSSTLVDLGAGTGELVLAAAPHCRRVVAVDVSPAMLQSLATKIEQRGLTNVELVRAGFLSYAHRGEPADFVYSRHALHHVPDFWKAVALQRIAALLRPGGILRLRDLFFGCNPSDVPAVVEAWLAGAAASSELGWTREELAIHLRTEYSTFTWLIEPMLERAGFRVDSAEYDPSRPYAAYTCTRV